MSIIPVVLLSAFILAPKVGLVDYSVLVLAAWFLPLWISNPRKLVLAVDGSVLIPVLWLVLIGLAIVGFLYHGRVSSEILFKPVRQLILLPVLIYLFRRYGISLSEAVAAILLAATANGCVVILQYVLHAAGVSASFLIVPGFDASIVVPYRKPGLTAGYPAAGMLSVFGIIFAASWLKSKRGILVVVAVAICILSVLITSRMALLFALVSIAVFVFPAAVAQARLFVLYSSMFIVGVLAFREYSGLLHRDTIGVIFELFINLTRGELRTQSTTALFESYSLLPDRLSTLLIGNGYMNMSDSMMNVDTGIQVILLGGGVFALATYVALSVLYFRKALTWVRASAFVRAVVVVFALVMISNVKTDAFFSRSFGDAFLLLVAGGCASKSLARCRRAGAVT